MYWEEGKLLLNISLCMIVRNEEDNLSKCLDSVKNLVNEIIIVDTGSVDMTKNIALQYTPKVYDYTWDNDFSKARNFSIEYAENDMILILDADEVVKEYDINELEDFICAYSQEIGRLIIINEFNTFNRLMEEKVRLGRVFSKKHYQYSGMIHEQLISISGTENIYHDISITLRHNGYNGDLKARKLKAERNISLLLSQLKETPENPYLYYQLGKSYYMKEEFHDTVRYLEKALEFNLNTKLDYVIDLVETYGYALINTEQYEVALHMLNIYDEFNHSADFLFLIALILMNNEYYEEAIQEFIKATKKNSSKVIGVNGELAYYNIGVIYECLGDKLKAQEYYNKCSNIK